MYRIDEPLRLSVIVVLILWLMATITFADVTENQTPLPNLTSNESLVTLNDRLRQVNSRLSELTGIAYYPIQLGSSTKVAGVLPVVNGGTGATTPATALNNLLTDQAGNAGKVLTTDGSIYYWGSGGPSNVLFQWHGNNIYNAGNYGLYSGTSDTSTVPSQTYNYLVTKTTSYQTLFQTKWIKDPSVSTITLYVYTDSAGDANYLKLIVGTASNSTSYLLSTFAWKTFSVDVSSLTNGTAYDVSFQVKNEVGLAIRIWDIMAFGS